MKRLIIGLVRSVIIIVVAMSVPPMQVKADSLSRVTVSFSSADLGGIGIYEAGNRIYIGDTPNKSIHVLDGTTNQQVATITGLNDFNGGDIIVNETYGKAFFPYGTGYYPSSTGEIDTKTNAVITTTLPPGILVHDEQHDRLYIVGNSQIYSLDIASGAQSPLHAGVGPVTDAVINPVTQELALGIYFPAKIIFIDVTTGNTSSFDVAATGGNHALGIAVNTVENKYYEPLITVPGQGEMGIFILDRDTNLYKFVGASDLEPLVFNPVSNTLFSGGQVGTLMAIVDGKTDQLTSIDVHTNANAGHSAGAVRYASDHAYFTSQNQIALLDNLFKTVDYISLPIEDRGGVVASSVMINQSTGKVYVIADNETGLLFILQDPPGAGIGDLIQDGSFESGMPDLYWRAWGTKEQTSPVLCNTNICGTNGAHEGSAWSALGGLSDESKLSQTGIIPPGKTHLSFWLQAPHVGSFFFSEYLSVQIDGKDILLTIPGNTANDYKNYTRVSLDIRRYADGKLHRIEFYSETISFMGEPGTTFNVDQVSLETNHLMMLPMIIHK